MIAQQSPIPVRRKRVVVWVILLAVAVAAALWLRSIFSPPWRVLVDITNIPTGTNFASLVVDSGGILSNMDWSPSSELATPFTMHPAQCIWSYQNPENPRVWWNAFVRWQPGERYGVVTRSTDGTWRVSWFGADSVPIEGRLWVLGGGKASFDLSAGQTVPLSAEQVKSLGLDKVLGLE